MTEQEGPKLISLSDVFAKVQLTAGDASLLLDGLSAMYSDKSPTLHSAFKDAMVEITTVKEEPPVEEPQTTSY